MIESDHRQRFAAERRQRMRIRLMQSALQLMATKGPANTSIDDVIIHAEVSRGTFYKYFDTPADLMVAVAKEVSNEILRELDPVVLTFDEPAERLSAGIRLILRFVRSYPVLGSFIVRIGWPHIDHSEHLFYTYVVRDIKLGMRSGSFKRMHLDVAANVMAGSLIGAINTLSTSKDAPNNYPDQMALCVLKGLGVEREEARRIISIKLPSPKLRSESIFLTVTESLLISSPAKALNQKA
jgi:TetR/AcrR family transcriptional regulator, ethionamide resistance regulator